MPIQVVATLTPNLTQTVADLQPGDMLLLCLDGTWDTQPGMPGDILSIGEPYTAVTPPDLYEMDHPREGTTEYPHQWQPWVMWASRTLEDWSDGYAFVCAWMITGFTGGPHNISINYPDGQLLWGKVIRGVDPAKWGHRYVRAAEISQGTNGQIVYNDFPHTVNIDSDDALVLHVFYPQTEFDPTIAPTQPEDYGPQIYALTGNESSAPILYHLRTIAPAATSFTMSQPNMILGDPRFFPSAVEVWYIILYGGAGEPPDEDGAEATRVTQVGAYIGSGDSGGSEGEDSEEATRITQVAAYIESFGLGVNTGNPEDDKKTRITQVAAYVESLKDGEDTGDPDDGKRTRITQVGAYIGSADTGGDTGGVGEDGVDATRVTQVAAYIGADDTAGSTGGVGEDGAEATRVTQVATYVGADDTAGSTDGIGEDGAEATRITQVATYIGADDTAGSSGGVGEDGAEATRLTQIAAYIGADDTAGSTGGVGEDGAEATRVTQVAAYVGANDTAGSTGGVGEDGAEATRLTQIAAYVGANDTAGSTGGVGEDGAEATRLTQIAAYIGADDTAGSTDGVGEDGAGAARLTQVGMYIEATRIEIPPAPGSTEPIEEGEESTWGRYWQLSAEGQSVADVARYGTGAYPVISSEKAFTGAHSYRSSAAAAVHENAAFGFALPPGQTVRCNLLINHNSVTPSPITDARIVDVLKLDCAGATVAVQWNSTDNTLELRAGFAPGTDQPRYPIARVTAGVFDQVDTWHSIGLTARLAESGGFISFYLDQKRLLTWSGDTRVYASGSSTPVQTITGIYATGSPENSDWCGGWAAWCYVDDFYADAGDGSEANLPAPLIRFFPRFRRPGAADIKAEMTVVGALIHGEAIGEAPPDDDATYVGASSPLQDIYPLTDVMLDDGWTPTAQIAIGYARRADDAKGGHVIMGIANQNGSTLNGDSAPLNLTYGYVGNRFTADSDEQPWTQETIDATNLSVAADGEF